MLVKTLTIRGIKGFQEFSFLDWPGKVSAVLFLAGCNIRCVYCHNHLIVNNPSSVEDISYRGVIARLKNLKGWIDGVVISGGEATTNPELFPLLEALKEEGFKTKLDTNGFLPDVVGAVLQRGLVDCVALDVKAPFSSDLYFRVTGVSLDPEKVRDTYRLLVNNPVEHHVRVTLVPSLGLGDYKYLIEELGEVKHLILQKFRPGDILDAGLNDLANFSDEDIKHLADFAAVRADVVTVPGFLL